MLNPTPPSTTIHLSSTLSGAALQSGRSYAGVVRAQPDGLVALVGGLQIPLVEPVDLVAGQRIIVQVQGKGDGLQLSIRSEGAAPPPPTPPVANLLAALLSAADHPDLARHATTLLPRQTPANTTVLRALVSSLLTERGTGKDLQQLQQFIANATAQGILPPDSGAALSPWLSLTAMADASAWQDLVRRARSERNAIARMAQTLGGEKGTSNIAILKESLLSLTRQLLGDQAFQTWLREQGMEERFSSLTEGIVERASGNDVQHLRSLDQPYQFLELPLSDSHGFRRLQLHFFSEGGQRQQQRDGVHRTVLDLELTQLGAVWVDVQVHEQHCRCLFQLESAELCDRVTTAATELETALLDLGYARVAITATGWDGNRARALLALMKPFQALDLEA